MNDTLKTVDGGTKSPNLRDLTLRINSTGYNQEDTTLFVFAVRAARLLERAAADAR